MPDGIPTLPGPFNWLNAVGDAGASIINSQTERELRRREEQRQQAQILAGLISSGSVDPSQIQGPAQQGFYAATGGIDPAKISTSAYTLKEEGAKQAKQKTAVGQEEVTQAGQKTKSGALDLGVLAQHAAALSSMTPDEAKEFYGIKGPVDVAAADDKTLQDVAHRFVWAARGDARKAYAAAQVSTVNPEVRAKLKEEFFGQAAAEWANEQKKLDAELLRARREYQGRPPSEVLDDFLRVNVAQQGILQAELAKLPIVDINSPDNNKALRESLTKQLEAYREQAKLINDKAMKMHGIETTPALTPPPPTGGDPAVAKIKAALDAGTITIENVRTMTKLTDAQKQAVLGSAYKAPATGVSASPTGGLTPPPKKAEPTAAETKKKNAKKFTDTLGLSTK